MGASLLPTSGRGSPSLLIWNASQARDFGPVTAAVLASEGLYARGASSSVSCLRSPSVAVRPSLASAHTPVRSPGGILLTPRLGKELCSPLPWPLGDTQAAGAVASGWRSGRPVWCWETDWQPGPSSPSSRGRAGCVRGGGGGCTPRPPWPGELAPGVVSAALSRRCPLAARPPERSGNETGRARSGTVAAASQCARSGPGCRGCLRNIRALFCLFFHLLKWQKAGGFPAPRSGSRHTGLSFLGPATLKVPAVFSQAGGQLGGGSCEVGELSFCMGGPLGDPEICFVCVCWEPRAFP